MLSIAETAFPCLFIPFQISMKATITLGNIKFNYRPTETKRMVTATISLSKTKDESTHAFLYL